MSGLGVKEILVLCTGNICRSPIAEALFVRELSPRGIRVSSAGLGALEGYPADPMALRVCADIGIDLTPHRARQVKREHLAGADLVFVMEASQRFRIMEAYPFATGKTFLLDQTDIEDPYRLPAEAFLKARDQISQAVQKWVPRLV